mgnify:CR=1 FL=1
MSKNQWLTADTIDGYHGGFITYDTHYKRIGDARAERDKWRNYTIIVSIAACVVILVLLTVAVNALDSQAVSRCFD